MTSFVSVRLDKRLLRELRVNAHSLCLSQTDYIRKAISQMNDRLEQKKLDRQLREASLKVRDESMRINAEFSAIEYDPEL